MSFLIKDSSFHKFKERELIKPQLSYILHKNRNLFSNDIQFSFIFWDFIERRKDNSYNGLLIRITIKLDSNKFIVRIIDSKKKIKYKEFDLFHEIGWVENIIDGENNRMIKKYYLGTVLYEVMNNQILKYNTSPNNYANFIGVILNYIETQKKFDLPSLCGGLFFDNIIYQSDNNMAFDQYILNSVLQTGNDA